MFQCPHICAILPHYALQTGPDPLRLLEVTYDFRKIIICHSKFCHRQQKRVTIYRRFTQALKAVYSPDWYSSSASLCILCPTPLVQRAVLEWQQLSGPQGKIISQTKKQGWGRLDSSIITTVSGKWRPTKFIWRQVQFLSNPCSTQYGDLYTRPIQRKKPCRYEVLLVVGCYPMMGLAVHRQ